MKPIAVVGIVIFSLIAISIPIIIIVRKKANDRDAAMAEASAASVPIVVPPPATPSDPICIPYTLDQRKNDEKNCRKKCNKKLIPWKIQDCLDACIRNLLPIKSC